MSAGSGLERPFELNAGVATLRFEADRQRFDGGSHLHGYKARLSQWRAFSEHGHPQRCKTACFWSFWVMFEA